MERLGFLYLKGPGEITRDDQAAFNMFIKAADLGGVLASYELGYMYYYGVGIEKNPQEASKWFARSTELAARKREPSFVATTDDRSSEKLKTIFSSVTVKENERKRQKNLNDQINSNDPSGPVQQLEDVSRY
jgi:hypothetical protein